MRPRLLTPRRGGQALAALLGLTTGCTMLSGLADLEVGDAPSDADGGSLETGSPDGSERIDRDGAVDSGVPREAGPADAATAASATVLCSGVECRGRCCLDGNNATCSDASTCAAAPLAELTCDEPSDCPDKQACCLTVAGTPIRSACASSCTPIGSSIPLCRSPADCPIPFTRCEPLASEFGPNTGWGYCE